MFVSLIIVIKIDNYTYTTLGFFYEIDSNTGRYCGSNCRSSKYLHIIPYTKSSKCRATSLKRRKEPNSHIFTEKTLLLKKIGFCGQ